MHEPLPQVLRLLHSWQSDLHPDGSRTRPWGLASPRSVTEGQLSSLLWLSLRTGLVECLQQVLSNPNPNSILTEAGTASPQRSMQWALQWSFSQPQDADVPGLTAVLPGGPQSALCLLFVYPFTASGFTLLSSPCFLTFHDFPYRIPFLPALYSVGAYSGLNGSPQKDASTS